ncbi:Ribokinase-like protein [Parathielavia hyrcaniae]|uniref:Ribokinase-like protein n=1 Tax=Parathielavia hyrcaniae TaxID=113614 RepID=A0AAN6T4M9_9PEZI|nr:Ribokinase-like protein [Parathielavia hyrcaniae]
MKHIILVGACYLDTILTVSHFPKEDSKLRATAAQVRRGGNCPNTLEVLVQLLRAGPARLAPIKLHLVSCLPNAQAAATARIMASFGDDADEAHDSSAIDFSHCLYRQGHDKPASSYIIRSAQTGSRTIVNFNDLEEMTAGEFEKIADAFAGQGDECWWHFEGRMPETTLRCIRYLRRCVPGSTISVEVEKPNRDGLAELAVKADVVFYSKSWAEPRIHQSGGLFKGRGGVIESGAGALETSSGEYSHHHATVSGQRVSAVDTIGAGDTFVAGMLYGLHARGWSVRERLAFAVRLATKKVQREGFGGLVP